VQQALQLQHKVESVDVWLKHQQEIALLNFQGVGVVSLCKSSRLRSKSKAWARLLSNGESSVKDPP
jgi:hypothetical protein